MERLCREPRIAAADLYAERGEIRRVGEQADEYNFTIGNGGPALARQIRVWITSHRSSASAADDALPPLRTGETQDVAISAAWILTRNGDPVVIMARWVDDLGDHEKPLLEMPSAHGMTG